LEKRFKTWPVEVTSKNPEGDNDAEINEDTLGHFEINWDPL
jgi:hypothetical protein